MLGNALTHWRSTLAGIGAGALGALAVTPNLDKMTAMQALAAFGACLLVAIKGALSADAANSTTAGK